MLRPDFRGWLLFGLPGILILGECRIGNPPAAAYIRWTVLSPFPAIVSRFGVLSWKKPCSGFFHLYPIKWKLYTIQCRLKSHLHTESREITHVVSGIVVKSHKQHDVNQYWQGNLFLANLLATFLCRLKHPVFSLPCRRRDEIDVPLRICSRLMLV